MAVFYTDSGSISDLVVSNRLDATGSLFGTASMVKGASYVEQVNIAASAGASSNNVSQLVFSNSNGIDFGLNGSTVTADAVGGAFTYPYFNPKDVYLQTLGTWGSATVFIQPIQVENVQFDRIALPIYISKPGNNNSNLSLTLSIEFGLYTRNGSTLSLMTDNFKMSSIQTTVSNTNNSIYDGIRLFTLGLTNTLTKGQYYAAILSNITTGGQGSISNIVQSQLASTFIGFLGEAPNRTVQYTRGLGVYSATVSDLPSSIAISQIYGAASALNDAAATIYLRPPLFYFVSQTF